MADAPSGIAVIIPCFQAQDTIRKVVAAVGPEVGAIYCVNDGSRDATGRILAALSAEDGRVVVLERSTNGGVGAATIDGYRRAMSDGWQILVKLDSDGQMDPSIIPQLAEPISENQADYVKGNRFFSMETVRSMPSLRIIGNAGVSFFTKMSSGYWNLFDPTNGFTALNSRVAAALPLDKLNKRFFFESDMLFRLYTIRAVVLDLPMRSKYGHEHSHLNELHALIFFPWLHLRNALKRLAYMYFLRNFSIASVNLIVGMTLLIFGTVFGAGAWYTSAATGTPATAGTVMLSALPFLVGVQLILSFVAYDMTMVPNRPVGRQLVGEPELVEWDSSQ